MIIDVTKRIKIKGIASNLPVITNLYIFTQHPKNARTIYVVRGRNPGHPHVYLGSRRTMKEAEILRDSIFNIADMNYNPGLVNPYKKIAELVIIGLKTDNPQLGTLSVNHNRERNKYRVDCILWKGDKSTFKTTYLGSFNSKFEAKEFIQWVKDRVTVATHSQSKHIRPETNYKELSRRMGNKVFYNLNVTKPTASKLSRFRLLGYFINTSGQKSTAHLGTFKTKVEANKFKTFVQEKIDS